MHILAAILMFVIGSISAACDGDFSGLEAIGKFLLYGGLIVFVMWALTNPVALFILVAVIVLISAGGVLFFKEKISRRQMAAMAAILVALVLLNI